MKIFFSILFTVTIFALFSITFNPEVESADESSTVKPKISESMGNDTSPELRLITPIPPEAGDTIRVIPNYPIPRKITESSTTKDKDEKISMVQKGCSVKRKESY